MRNGLAYNPALDGIRAFAIVLVFFCHTEPAILPKGGIGVDIFFVLSGYLITSILLREREFNGGINVLRFYARRARRLYPALLLMLICCALLAAFLWEVDPINIAQDVGAAAIYISDYTYAYTGSPRFLLHTWSLSAEEQFYLVWPLVLLFILRWRGAAPWILLGAYVLITFARGVAFESGTPFRHIYYTLHWHSTGLILGSAAAFLPKGLSFKGETAERVTIWLLLCLFIMALTDVTRGWHLNALTPAAEFVAVLLLIAARSHPVSLSNPMMVSLGKYSYGFYLWHYPILIALRPLPDVAGMVLGGSLSLALAAISYHTVERFFRVQRSPERTAIPA